MQSVHITTHTQQNGNLQITIPTEHKSAKVEVTVTIQPIPSNMQTLDQALIRELAGSWNGEPMERPDQGQYEQRFGLD